MNLHKTLIAQSLLLAFTVILLGNIFWLAPKTKPAGKPLPDFSIYSAGALRKAAFFSYLSPIVNAHNEGLLRQRTKLETIAEQLRSGLKLPGSRQRILVALASRYKVNMQNGTIAEKDLVLLQRKMDVIPASLVLVQAAMESAWGTSRFARSGNNLFGQWCYTPGCGIIPNKRNQGSTHEVRSFSSIENSVASYFLNINTHPTYSDLRTIRWDKRQKSQPVTGDSLAEGLLYYSEKREAYVHEIKSMIRVNRSYFTKPQTVSQP